LKIRKASAEDMEAVYGLLCELEEAPVPFGDFREIYLSNLGVPSVFYFVCENEDAVIAFASLHIQRLLHHCARVAEIQEIIVKSEYQGSGIGRGLFQALEAMARQAGCALLEVCCNRMRKRAHGFYERCGMTGTHYKFTVKL